MIEVNQFSKEFLIHYTAYGKTYRGLLIRGDKFKFECVFLFIRTFLQLTECEEYARNMTISFRQSLNEPKKFWCRSIPDLVMKTLHSTYVIVL